jgi:hypothetical protein
MAILLRVWSLGGAWHLPVVSGRGLPRSLPGCGVPLWWGGAGWVVCSFTGEDGNGW